MMMVVFPAQTVAGATSGAGAGESPSRISDEPRLLQVAQHPKRPRPLLEIGDPFLKPGPISRGFELPTGAVWQPSLMAWGTYRTALQAFDNGNDTTSEWANRFDLWANLYLTPTERILAGVRFLDQEGRFTGYTFRAPDAVREEGKGFDDHLNFDITTLFFEGDIGEIFPNLDPLDKRSLDYYFSIGRQPISYQGGMLINDNVDALGISKINLRPPTVSNMRTTFVWGANELNRTNLPNDDDEAMMYGVFNEIDWKMSTVELDAIYVYSSKASGRGVYLGLGSTQRLGKINSTFRVLGSIPVATETLHNRSGVLLFNELSLTPHGTDDLAYLNAFVAFDEFRSASRDPTVGGPLGPTGILFEAVGLGRYPAPLSNAANEAIGAAIGYQWFFDNKRKQLILEIGGRYTDRDGQRAAGTGLRYQIAVGQRGILRFDGHAVYDRDRSHPGGDKDEEVVYGLRVEFVVKF
ncbi:MAG: hypothetical protein K8I00_04235 [Candidatus Omnitrophica bacterium]|nr:hypothetical protein [Candidatus Omnitrophota bacterium]